MSGQIKEDFSEKELGLGESTPHVDAEEIRPESRASRDEEESISIQQEIRPRVSKEDRPGVLTRIITAATANSWADPGPPPDGGRVAWTQAAMGHLVIMQTWGYISSYGVFQTYYTAALGQTPSAISWVGSVQIFLLFFIGTVSGRATDAGLFRYVFCTGLVLQLLGVFMTSLCTQYWQLFLAQGICTGIGNGLQFCPTVALISTYFAKRRSLAIGITASGSATGGLIYPAVVRSLLPQIGFGWTVRVLGFITMGTGLITACLLRTRLPPRKSGPLVEWRAFRELPYALYILGMFLNFWGIYFAFYYVGAFGRDIIGIPYTDSINLLMIMNGVGYVTRVVPNFFADAYTGPLNMIIPFAFIAGIVLYGWAGVQNVAGLNAFAVIYGLASAGMQGLFPAALSSLTTDLKKAGVRMGMGFSIVSVACLTGPPLAGALITSNGGNYLHAQMWAGTAMTLGGCTLIASRIAKTGFKFKVRV